LSASITHTQRSTKSSADRVSGSANPFEGGATMPSTNRMPSVYSAASDSRTRRICSRVRGAARWTACESASPITAIV
jgi:hypothetical protein